MALAIYQWGADDKNYLQYRWRSGVKLLPAETNFSYGRVVLDAEFYQRIIDTIDLISDNQVTFSGDIQGALRKNTLRTVTLRGDSLKRVGDYSLSSDVTVNIYEDGELKASATVSVVDSIFALPKGFTIKRPVVEATGYVPVFAVILAQSVEELQSW